MGRERGKDSSLGNVNELPSDYKVDLLDLSYIVQPPVTRPLTFPRLCETEAK